MLTTESQCEADRGGALVVNLRYLVRVNNLFPEEGVLSGAAVEQPPVHAQVPDQCVQRADGGEDDQQVEEGVRIRMLLL